MTPEKNNIKLKLIFEILRILGFSIFVYIIAGYYDILENIVELSKQYEEFEIDEFITVSIFLVFVLAFSSFVKLRKIQKTEALLNSQNKKLQTALSEIKQLRGIIPICSGCKQIRDDKGYWHQVESYICDHTDAEFSHGICPLCMKKLYPEFIDNEAEIKKEKI